MQEVDLSEQEITEEEVSDGQEVNILPLVDVQGKVPMAVEFQDVDLEELMGICQSLIDAVKKEKALGIAAIQIGIPYKIAVVRLSVGSGRDMLVPVINPSYYKMGERTKSVEWCLTLPNESFVVKRYKNIKARFLTFNKEGTNLIEANMKLKGLDAFVFQHETDHCNGILCSEKGKKYKG